MSAPVPCAQCGKAVSSSAARCPHCGDVQRDVGGLGDAKVTAEEAAALLLFHDGGELDPEPSPYGLIGSLFMPHPATRGAHRAAELALTVLGLPVILGGMLAFALLPRSYRQATEATPLGALGLMAVVGGLAAYAVVAAIAGGGTLAIALPLASVTALAIRYMVQRSAISERRPDLVGKLEPGAADVELPLAIARDVSEKRDDPVVDGELIAVPDTPEEHEPGSEPSFLK